MTAIEQVLQHDPSDIDPTLPMRQSKFWKWLSETNCNAPRLQEALARYYGVSREELKGQFTGEVAYVDGDRQKTMSIHDCFRYVYEQFIHHDFIPDAFVGKHNLSHYIDFAGRTEKRESVSQMHVSVRVNQPEDGEEEKYQWLMSFYAVPTESLKNFAAKNLIYGDTMSEYHLTLYVEPAGDGWDGRLLIVYDKIIGSRTVQREVHFTKEELRSLLVPVDVDPAEIHEASVPVGTKGLPPAPMGTKAISPQIREWLHNMTWDDGNAKLTAQLTPKQYVSVKKVLADLGGTWSKKLQTHVFDEDGEDRVRKAIGYGFYVPPVDEKKLFQTYETPPEVADRLVELAEVTPECACMEPSAGAGAIAEAMRSADVKSIQCFEVQPNFVMTLRSMGFSVEEADFLTVIPEPWFDRVVMNPPFSKGQDIKHVLHAHKFLKPGGTVTAIMSRGWEFRSHKASAEFRQVMRECGTVLQALPSGTFKAAGTLVETVIVQLKG